MVSGGHRALLSGVGVREGTQAGHGVMELQSFFTSHGGSAELALGACCCCCCSLGVLSNFVMRELEAKMVGGRIRKHRFQSQGGQGV